MNPDNPLHATDPQRDASVHASAGTGKTWLLVTRVVRLLLAGARAESILAVTFTRKAAAEMEQRIMERLREMACSSREQLDKLLQQAGIDTDAATREQAARLYEIQLCNPRRLRCTTFHAFCNDLLARFPLEAGIPPGFELMEKTGQLEQSAYAALLNDSIRHPQHPVTRALDILATGCGSLENAQQALSGFLATRSDWWAWTDVADHPADPDAAPDQARAQLVEFLAIDPDAPPLAKYPDDIQRARHRQFAELLRANTDTDKKLASGIDFALEHQLTGQDFLESIRSAYLTDENSARKRKDSPTQQKRLGMERAAQLMKLHERGCEEVLEQRDILARYRSLALNTAWYQAGHALLSHYQRIKRERRMLDLTDLEWLACRLLNRSEHASWVQYKLDARIDHLLIDEFQDTNPTQWRLLLPLLEELAAGDSGRQRSAFLVGDRKQSIYGFRRANPALLESASVWLQQQRNGQPFRLDRSRRSASAVMEGVNRVFTRSSLTGLLADFVPHETHLKEVYGEVTLLPLCSGTGETPAAEVRTSLRNPLHEPRPNSVNQACLEEGRLIAQRIRQLLADQTCVEKDGELRRLDHGDILILLRQRTQASVYEQALREAGIPCLGASRGLLLDNLEVRDLVALLDCLVSPHDNLALAQVLRSPLFGVDSEQLLELLNQDGLHWYARLQQLADSGKSPWQAIRGVLARWRTLAGQLPVHDLLDRIFHEGSVVQRYSAAFPPVLQPRVRASFTRFIELALEIDNGRYPSLPRFLDQLARLRQSDRDQPDESAPDDSGGNRVRLMTVHSAKGLEAPVVFLADAARVPKDRSAWRACVDWPEQAARPAIVLLAASKALRDNATAAVLDRQAGAAATEDANLLYVALTRARQYLFISGNAKPGTRNTGWYGAMQSAMDDLPVHAAGEQVLTSGTRKSGQAAGSIRAATPVVPAGLAERIQCTPRDLPIAPSRLGNNAAAAPGDADGRERGIAIHRMLELLTGGTRTPGDSPPVEIANGLQCAPEDIELQRWWDEACAVVRHAPFAPLFDPACYRHAWNESPVQYLDGRRMVHGIIDRLVMTDREVLVVDYKTHVHATRETIPSLLAEYRDQLACYQAAASRLWPDRQVRSALLFTACTELVWLDALQ